MAEVEAVATIHGIRNLPNRRQQAWKMNNTALKSLRDSNKDPLGFPTVATIDLTAQDPCLVHTLHRTTGME